MITSLNFQKISMRFQSLVRTWEIVCKLHSVYMPVCNVLWPVHWYVSRSSKLSSRVKRGLTAVLIKNRHSASGRGISEKTHSIAELEAGFMILKYASLSEI